MNYSLSSDQVALRDAVEKACEGELAWGKVDTQRAWQIYSDLGLLGVVLPEAHGGSGLGMAEVMLIAHTLGKVARGWDWICDSLVPGQIPARCTDLADPENLPLLAQDCGNAALCALMAGASESLLALARAHLLTRKQFGSPLAKFQALQHRLADMAMDVEQCCAMACLAAMACEWDCGIDLHERQRQVSAAKAICCGAARRTAYAAVQLHGATGITDARIGDLVRLILRSEKQWGDKHDHLLRMEKLGDLTVAYIVGAYEHPTRKADGLSVLRLHADVAIGALTDAGLSLRDVDAYFCAGDAPGLGTATVAEYLGLRLTHIDATDCGGSAPIVHLSHAAQAIAAGRCKVALITLAGRPRAAGASLRLKPPDPDAPELAFELPYGPMPANLYGMVARRHMHEFGTTSEQLAWIKVAASHHAQHNPRAVLPKVVTVEDVLQSSLVADPLHKLDCCVISDGGGALVVASAAIAKSIARPQVRLIGAGEAPKHGMGGQVDLTWSAARLSGASAFAQAGVTPADIQYASLYDSFTITVLMQLEDLGFCEKGQGGRFVMDGNLISGIGKLPFNTDGGGLCNNHPANRGGITKIIEAVRQLRGEAHPKVQVPNCRLALASGIGGALGSRHTAATAILERVA